MDPDKNPIVKFFPTCPNSGVVAHFLPDELLIDWRNVAFPTPLLRLCGSRLYTLRANSKACHSEGRVC